jgi:hypothetical protein
VCPAQNPDPQGHTAERWENTIFRPTIYHQALIDVCVKNHQIIVILEANTLWRNQQKSPRVGDWYMIAGCWRLKD